MIDRRNFIKLACLAFGTALARLSPAQGPETSPANRPRKIVFIHGRNQQGKDPEALKRLWTETLKKGVEQNGGVLPDDVAIALPFYGDMLDDFASQFQIPLTTDIQTKGADVNAEFLAFQARVAEDLRRQAGISDEQIDAEYGPNPKEKGPQNWEWVQAILRAIDKHASGASQATLEVFMRDVFLYTKRAGVRHEIDRVVASELSADEPAVVVSHSLGSVVAYNILRSSQGNLSVPLFVTLGSPLGIRAIRDEFRPLRFPESAHGWFNAFDIKDVVALFPLDGTNFPVTPAIENFSSVENHTDNHHGIVGYLDDKEVARRILEAIK